MTPEEELNNTKKMLRELEQQKAKLTHALEQHTGMFPKVANLIGAYYRSLAKENMPLPIVQHLIGYYQIVLFAKDDPKSEEYGSDSE